VHQDSGKDTKLQVIPASIDNPFYRSIKDDLKKKDKTTPVDKTCVFASYIGAKSTPKIIEETSHFSICNSVKKTCCKK
jgi:hypothetical protein